MARNYPMCTEQVQTGCVHLQMNDIHHQILEDLEGSIRVITTGIIRDVGGSVKTVLQFLMSTFGGTMQHYKYWKCGPTTFRVQLPHALNRHLVIEQGREWGERNGWTMVEWDPYVDAGFQEKNFRVRVKITQFPEEFWHPYFIQQVAAQFGDIERTYEVNIIGHNHMNLCLWVRCIDPRRIPYFTTLPYGRLWKKCVIQVIAWEYKGEIPPDLGLPPPEDSGDRYGSDTGQTEYLVRRSMVNFHDRIMSWRRAQPLSPEPSSGSNQTDTMEEPDTPDTPRVQDTDVQGAIGKWCTRQNEGGPQKIANRDHASSLNGPEGAKKVTKTTNNYEEYWSKEKLVRVTEGKAHKGNWSPYATPSLKVNIDVGSITVISQEWGSQEKQNKGYDALLAPMQPREGKEELSSNDWKNKKRVIIRTVVLRVGQLPICLVRSGGAEEIQKGDILKGEPGKMKQKRENTYKEMEAGWGVTGNHKDKYKYQTRMVFTIGDFKIQAQKIREAKPGKAHGSVRCENDRGTCNILGGDSWPRKKKPLQLQLQRKKKEMRTH